MLFSFGFSELKKIKNWPHFHGARVVEPHHHLRGTRIGRKYNIASDDDYIFYYYSVATDNNDGDNNNCFASVLSACGARENHPCVVCVKLCFAEYRVCVYYDNDIRFLQIERPNSNIHDLLPTPI